MNAADVLSEIQCWLVGYHESFLGSGYGPVADPDSHHTVTVRRRVLPEWVPEYSAWRCDCACGRTLYCTRDGESLLGLSSFVLAACEHLVDAHGQCGTLASVTVEGAAQTEAAA